jgi:hypothetical protein
MGLELSDLGEISEQPREHIPDTWAGKGSCPVCHATNTLDVTHIEDGPDRFVCRMCRVAFEVQSSGESLIRVKVIPDVLKPVWSDIFNRWLDPDDLHTLFQRHRSEKQQKTPDEGDIVSDSTMADRDVMKRVIELKKLGNDDETVELLLYQAGAATNQVNAALSRYHSATERQTKGRSSALGWMIFAAVMVLALLVGLAWMASELGLIDLSPQISDNVEGVIAELIPLESFSDFKVDVLPEIVRGGPTQSVCPDSRSKAATLFGGTSAVWSFRPESNAWVMVNNGDPVTVRVPANMDAGVINFESMTLRVVSGAALIRNANVVAVVCE